MSASVLCFLTFCAGIWYERARVDRLSKAHADRIMRAVLAEPHRTFTPNRAPASFELDGWTTYTVPDVDALIALSSRSRA